MARTRFGHPLKPSKPPQQLSKALEPQNPPQKLWKALEPQNTPQQLSKASRLLCQWYLPRPHNCFYWASKLLRGTFSAPSKPPQQLSKALEPQNPLRQLSKASRLLCHGTSLGPTSCLHWASKLLRGTFWAPLKTLKTFAAAFEGLRTAKPSAAAFEGVPSTLPWYLLGPTICFYWASKLLRGTFWAPLKTLKTSAAAFEGLRTSKPSAAPFEGVLGPIISCFYWASKLPRGTFWGPLKTFKTYPAAFEGLRSLRTSKPSAAAFEGIPPALPWHLPRPHKLFLRNCYVVRFGHAFKPSKPSQQLSNALEPQNPPQQLSKASRLLCHDPSLSCFYWASKLLRGTFWVPLKTLKTLRSSFQRRPACFAIVPP